MLVAENVIPAAAVLAPAAGRSVFSLGMIDRGLAHLRQIVIADEAFPSFAHGMNYPLPIPDAAAAEAMKAAD